jgi:hypothetical protein
VKCRPLGENDPTTGKHEQMFNTFAVTKTGAYIVTSERMYRVWAGSDDQPYVVWSEPYDTIGEIRPGQYELGSGTSPTILGEGKYVAITDIAEQLQVVVFRTDERLGPKETRKVCEVPVFEDQEGGANSNSLIGSRLSLIVENTYDYAMYWQQDGKKPSAPGFERIDINPNGKAARRSGPTWMSLPRYPEDCLPGPGSSTSTPGRWIRARWTGITRTGWTSTT